MKSIMNKRHAALIASAASGILTAISFSVEKLWFLCFFSLIPLFSALLHGTTQKRRSISASVFIFSVCYYIPLTLWLFELDKVVEIQLGDWSKPVIFLGILIIALAMGGFMTLAFLPLSVLRRKNQPLNVITISFLFILGEFLQGMLPDFSFPWGRIGVIATPFTQYIQSASLFGCLFVSLITLMINGFIALWLTDLKRPLPLFIAAGIFAANTGYGAVRQYNLKAASAPDKTALLVQGNFAGINKWTFSASDILSTYLQLAQDGLDESISLVVFPESAVPGNFADTKAKTLYNAYTDFVKKNDVTLITGVFIKENDINYNSMVAIYPPDGAVSEPYNKRRLVPVGEYLPYLDTISRVFPQLAKLIGYYTPGDECVTIPVSGGTVGGVICYESIFADTVRESVKKGANLLVIVSNDSWFGDSCGVRQHHAHAIMRAVENNRYVLRNSSTAITSAIAPWGEVVSSAPMLERAVLRADYELRSGKTLYTLAGDIIIIPALVLYAAAVVTALRSRLQKRKPESQKGSSDTTRDNNDIEQSDTD